jgi:hypothetical protein
MGNTRLVTYHGKRMGLAEAWRAAGCVVSYDCVRNRIEILGWTVEEAVTKPSRLGRPIIRDGSHKIVRDERVSA